MPGIAQAVELAYQPIGGVGANPQWIARRLLMADTVSGYAANAVTGLQDTFSGTSIEATRFGKVRRFGAASTDLCNTSVKTIGAARTLFIRAMASGAGGNGFGRMLDKNDGTTTELAAYYDGTLIHYIQAYDGGRGRWTITAPASGVPFVLAVSHDASSAANDPLIYLDGVLQSATEVDIPSGARVTVADQLSIGNRNADQARNWDGWLADALAFETVLTAAEIQALSVNPYQVWQPFTRYVPFSSSSPVTIACATGAALAAGVRAGVASPITVAASVGAGRAAGRSAVVASAITLAVATGAAVAAGRSASVSTGAHIVASTGAWTPVSPASGSWSAISPSSGTWTAQ